MRQIHVKESEKYVHTIIFRFHSPDYTLDPASAAFCRTLCMQHFCTFCVSPRSGSQVAILRQEYAQEQLMKRWKDVSAIAQVLKISFFVDFQIEIQIEMCVQEIDPRNSSTLPDLDSCQHQGSHLSALLHQTLHLAVLVCVCMFFLEPSSPESRVQFYHSSVYCGPCRTQQDGPIPDSSKVRTRDQIFTASFIRETQKKS